MQIKQNEKIKTNEQASNISNVSSVSSDSHKKAEVSDDLNFIQKLYGKYVFTSFVGILGSVLGQIVSNIIAGQILGSEALSVSGLIMPIYYAFSILGALLGIGGSVLCAQLIGKRQFDDCKKAFTVIYLASIISSLILIAVCVVFLDPILRLLGTTDELYDMTRNYALITVIGGFFTATMYPAFHLLRLDGKTTASVIVFLTMAGVNIALDFLFLLVFNMGMEGVALATAIGTACAAIGGSIWLFATSKAFSFVRVGVKEFFVYTGMLFRAGSPSAIENFCNLIRSLALNLIVIGSFGGIALSALSVTGSVNSFAQVLISGVAFSIVPLVGVFAAEKDISSIRQVLGVSVKLGMALITVFTILCCVFSSQLAALFGMAEGEKLTVAAEAVLMFSISFIPAMLNKIVIALHQANKRTLIANILTVGRALVFVVLLAFISANTELGIKGFWLSFTAAELLTLAVGAVCSLIASHGKKNISKLTLIDTESEKNGRFISFSVENAPQAISECTQKIADFCEQNELPMKRTMYIQMSLDEMLNSISEHSLCGSKLTMNVRILIIAGEKGDVVILRIRNAGQMFNPIAYYESKQKKLSEDGDKIDKIDLLDELEDSLGIKMIMKMAESVDYRSTFGVNNLTILL